MQNISHFVANIKTNTITVVQANELSYAHLTDVTEIKTVKPQLFDPLNP